MGDLKQVLRREEQAIYRLRALYQSFGYRPYKMNKFEEYDLYAHNKSFLQSEQILTFTDTDGQLMALKPDVTLSIIKNTPETAGGLQKVYYHENVYRSSPAAAGYREIMQTGLECTGALDLSAMGEVLALAAESLALLSEEYLLDLGHVGLVSGLLAEQEGLEDKPLFFPFPNGFFHTNVYLLAHASNFVPSMNIVSFYNSPLWFRRRTI